MIEQGGTHAGIDTSARGNGDDSAGAGAGHGARRRVYPAHRGAHIKDRRQSGAPRHRGGGGVAHLAGGAGVVEAG